MCVQFLVCFSSLPDFQEEVGSFCCISVLSAEQKQTDVVVAAREK